MKPLIEIQRIATDAYVYRVMPGAPMHRMRAAPSCRWSKPVRRGRFAGPYFPRVEINFEGMFRAPAPRTRCAATRRPWRRASSSTSIRLALAAPPPDALHCRAMQSSPFRPMPSPPPAPPDGAFHVRASCTPHRAGSLGASALPPGTWHAVELAAFRSAALSVAATTAG